MQIKAEGAYRIISRDDQLKEFEVISLTQDSNNAEDYVEVFEFDYAKIFENVLYNTCMQGYVYPKNKEQFNNSPIWQALGFNPVSNFEIRGIIKYAKVEFYNSCGQEARCIIDFEEETIELDEKCQLNNALDSALSNLGNLGDKDGDEVSPQVCLHTLIHIFDGLNNQYSGDRSERIKTMTNYVRQYLRGLRTEDYEKIDKKQVDEIIKIMVDKI